MIDGLFRCGLPTTNLKIWLAQNGQELLRIASFGLSSYQYFGHYVPPSIPLKLLVGFSGIDPTLVADLQGASTEERWRKLLERSNAEQRDKVLKVLRKTGGWQRAGAEVRVALPRHRSGLMHMKLYLGSTSALVGSANFTAQGITGEDQHELLVELSGPPLLELGNWWSAMWAVSWPIIQSSENSRSGTFKQGIKILRNHSEENMVSSGPQKLLGHWLGKWGAWALNGNGVVAYPHQLQAVEWIRPDERAYLLGDEVGLGKTFTAALIWIRHQQLYGDKARLIYITKPSLIIDAISAFVSVLGVDEFLETTGHLPQRASDLRPNFSIFHASTSCWEMVADEDGRKRSKDHQVAGLLKEGRYRIRPEAFLKNKLEWLSAAAAKKLHEQINISAVARLLDSVYTFVS
ncbi:MAG: phospholipase D-like domain-containing protein, partial [Acidobacteriota bacterium]|nr:phospholipase D-like domain-containing protein [Acidobacteriota bacterium]